MRHLVLTTAAGALWAGVLMAQEPAGTAGTSSMPTATAPLVDSQGRTVGEARLQQTPNGVLLKLDLRNATPGAHALHIHGVGRCEGPGFKSAGDHFAPGGKKHGFLNKQGPHAGDLPNLDVPSTGQLSVEHLVKDVTLESGPASLLDADGSAIVIHASKDDYSSDPAGNAGDRIVCGAVRR